MKKIKRYFFKLINSSKVFEVLIISLIVINILFIILDTLNPPYIINMIFKYTEYFSVFVFTLEYILRIWTADLLYADKSPFKARIKFFFTFMSLIDLLAILPFYLPMLIHIDLRVLRLMRIIRLFRLFKINRYTSAFNTIGKVFKNKSGELVSSVLIVALLMLISSILMYNAEHEAQPEQFTSIFQAFWWAIATFTTVGYGDIFPVTSIGKLMAAVVSILGIGIVAIPTGIITAGFSEIVSQEKEAKDDCNKSYCPYCGNKLK